MRASTRSSVDFPEPFEPMIPMTLPRGTSKLTCRSAQNSRGGGRFLTNRTRPEWTVDVPCERIRNRKPTSRTRIAGAALIASSRSEARAG
jgi:hypothetical protein